MSDKPKVLIFAPREEPPETIKAIEGLGCEIVIGNRDWQLPRTHYEDDVVGAGARLRGADGHLDAPHPDQPPHDGGVAAAAHRRQIHRRRRRHRHRGRDRARHHGLPRADRVELLRRRRDHGGDDAVAAQEARTTATPTCAKASGARRTISPITSAPAPPTASAARPSASSASAASPAASRNC